jgi:hypothetical protein
MGLLIGLFGILIASSVFLFIMPLVMNALTHFFQTPQTSFKQGIKLTFGFLCLGPLSVAVVQLGYYVVGGSALLSADSSSTWDSVFLIVITMITYFFGMVLFVHQELDEPFYRAMRIAPIYLVAMVVVFFTFFALFSFLIAQIWLG